MANKGSVPGKNLSVDAERRRTGFSRGANQFVRILSRLQAEKKTRLRLARARQSKKTRKSRGKIHRMVKRNSDDPEFRREHSVNPHRATAFPFASGRRWKQTESTAETESGTWRSLILKIMLYNVARYA